MFADYHIHTEYSDDSIYPMEKVVKDAIAKNLKDICFTDHVDYGVHPDWEDDIPYKVVNGKAIVNVDYPKYFRELDELRKKYQGQIAIKRGLEFGIQTHTIEKYQALVDKWEMDFIILSVHQVGDKEFWNQDFQEGKTQKEYNDAYYEEIYQVITQFNDYSVLGHLDLIKRYDKEGNYPFAENKEILTKILTHIIENGKGIELNTSSKRYGLSDLTPSRDILKLYYDLGGSIISLGSDSHKEEHLGAYLEEAKVELKKIGFTKFCTFENMKPIFHEL